MTQDGTFDYHDQESAWLRVYDDSQSHEHMGIALPRSVWMCAEVGAYGIRIVVQKGSASGSEVSREQAEASSTDMALVSIQLFDNQLLVKLFDEHSHDGDEPLIITLVESVDRWQPSPEDKC